MKHHALLISLLLSLSLCVLDIYQPKDARQTYNNITIGYTVANFGHIPYGKSMIGNLFVVDPIENCNIESTIVPNYDSAFLLIKRGNCTFVQKVRNAEKLGAKLAIIMDNLKQNTGYLTMKDDGNGYLVNIPSVLISDTDGERLANLSKQYPELSLKIMFDTQKSDKVNLTIYTQANNRISYHFIRSLSQFYPYIKNHVNVKVVPHAISCYFCRPSDCIVEGKYCSVNYNLKSQVTGKDIIKQQLREQIVSKNYIDNWWTYMDLFDQECDNLLEAKACSAKLFKKLNIDANLVQSKLDKQLQTHELLNQNVADEEYSGVGSYPAVFLNNQKYLGNLKASYVFEQICSILNNPPEECGLSTSSPHTRKWLIVFFVILGSLVLFSIIFYFYKRRLNREMVNEINSTVSEQVSKYIQFYSSRQNQ